ncbi:Uncharacterized protein Fot_06695 [Forsythia ovata]|uniref:Uncharacterized protein n=1 Tax=Forsythia ovata TaxID=205694 RepID=A0ABD1WTQ0_9LAMI
MAWIKYRNPTDDTVLMIENQKAYFQHTLKMHSPNWANEGSGHNSFGPAYDGFALFLLETVAHLNSELDTEASEYDPIEHQENTTSMRIASLMRDIEEDVMDHFLQLTDLETNSWNIFFVNSFCWLGVSTSPSNVLDPNLRIDPSLRVWADHSIDPHTDPCSSSAGGGGRLFSRWGD